MTTILTPGLTFDPETHRYTLAGSPLESVTQILTARGLIDDQWFTEESRDRGTAVHAAVHYLNEDALDLASIDPRIGGYLDAYCAFRADTDFEPLACEVSLGSSRHGYAGTLDLMGWMRGCPLSLIDIKTGAHQRWHHVQLAAYERLVAENAEHLGLGGELPKRHLTLELRKTGRYVLHEVAQVGTETIAFYRARWSEALNLTHFLNMRAA